MVEISRPMNSQCRAEFHGHNIGSEVMRGKRQRLPVLANVRGVVVHVGGDDDDTRLLGANGFRSIVRALAVHGTLGPKHFRWKLKFLPQWPVSHLVLEFTAVLGIGDDHVASCALVLPAFFSRSLVHAS